MFVVTRSCIWHVLVILGAMTLIFFVVVLKHMEDRHQFFGKHLEINGPVILMWHPSPHQRRKMDELNGGLPVEAKLEKDCGGCTITNDRKALNRSKVIILHEDFRTYKRKSKKTLKPDIPSVRYPRQIYVFYTKENPYHTKHRTRGSSLEDYDGIFNMTMTYRRDSDVPYPYSCWPLVINEKNLHLIPKKKVALMLASDCFRVGAKLRKIYSDELIKAGLPLERYGHCFGRRYEGNLTELLIQFKFFMAFENTMECRDYLTEKFWTNSLDFGLVPVVWGPTKEDVQRVAPPHSFIHAADFESPKHLADYLLYLDSNHTAYMEYFKWRYIKPDESYPTAGCGYTDALDTWKLQSSFCDLCKKVSAGFHGSVKISQWWFGTENLQCLSKDMEFLMAYHLEKYGVSPSVTNSKNTNSSTMLESDGALVT